MTLPSLVAATEPTGFGCYIRDETLDLTPEKWRQHVRLMKQAGMNTFCTSYKGHNQLAYMIDIAIEEGMLETSIPVVVMGRDGEAQFRAAMGDAAYEQAVAKEKQERGAPPPGWGPIEALGKKMVAEKAKQISRCGDRWPEIVQYGPDEPGHGNPIEDTSDIAAVTQYYNDSGARCAMSCIHPNMKNLVPCTDIMIANAILGAQPDLKQVKEEVQRINAEQGTNKEFWVYEIGCREAMPKMVRWHMGYWTWQIGPRVHLSWSWTDYLTTDIGIGMGQVNEALRWNREVLSLNPAPERATQLQSRIEGLEAKLGQFEERRKEILANPQMNSRLRAYAEGVRDFYYLTNTEEKLKTMRDQFDWEGWPFDEFVRARDETGSGMKHAVPDIDFDSLLPAR